MSRCEQIGPGSDPDRKAWKNGSSSGEPEERRCPWKGFLKFQGGDFCPGPSSLEQLTPDDFRLRPDSAGYRAGQDGKDLGADVDLVGPGAAYERWKKTPEYQEWLKETGQIRVVGNSVCRDRRQHSECAYYQNKAAGEALPPSKLLTGPAPPRRSVCGAGNDVLPLYRKPQRKRCHETSQFCSQLRAGSRGRAGARHADRLCCEHRVPARRQRGDPGVHRPGGPRRPDRVRRQLPD